MTIFDMLDRLEADILALLSAAGAKKKPTAKKRPSNRKKRIQKAEPAIVSAQPQEVESGNGAANTEASRVLGKRQALGRSLLQLRKFSTYKSESENNS